MVTLNLDRRVGSGQGGFSLLMTLLSLLILSLSAMAMMSLLKAGVTTSGNIAFRQAAVRAGDIGVEDARTWLASQTSSYLENTDTSQGYWATSVPNFDPKTFPFAASARVHLNGSSGAPGTAVSAADKVSGYTVYFVIHRMATSSGKCDPATSNAACLFPPVVTASETGQGSSTSGGSGYGLGLSSSTGKVYYRVTVKVVGPRFNTRYVQALLY